MSDFSKMKKFNEKMGRQKHSKGGFIKHKDRKNFDAGGGVGAQVVPGVNPAIPLNATGTSVAGGGTGSVNTPQGVTQNASNLLGTNAVSANIQPGTNSTQLNNSYTGANNAINAQVGLTNTLTPQAATGVNAQNEIEAEELAMTQGAGPNPAQTQLAQETGQNVNQQAALAAGQRGSAANVGLLERQAAQTGAATEQNAVGQEATLEAQQQINAQQNAANIAANQVGQTQNATTALNTAQQNEQATLQNANTAANNAAVGMQSNVNNNNTSTNNGILAGIGNAVSNIPVIGALFAEGGEVEAPDHLKLAEMNAHSLNHNKKMASGGTVQVTTPQYQTASAGPGVQVQTSSPQNLTPILPKKAKQSQPMGTTSTPVNANITGSNNPLVAQQGATPMPVQSDNTGSQVANYLNAARGGKICKGKTKSHVANFLMAEGGRTKDVPAMVSPEEIYLNPKEVEMVQHGANPLKLGHKFKGKAKVKGDSLKNDNIPVNLPEGGVVLPRHITLKKDPEKASLFVLKSMKATGKHMKKPRSVK